VADRNDCAFISIAILSLAVLVAAVALGGCRWTAESGAAPNLTDLVIPKRPMSFCPDSKVVAPEGWDCICVEADEDAAARGAETVTIPLDVLNALMAEKARSTTANETLKRQTYPRLLERTVTRFEDDGSLDEAVPDPETPAVEPSALLPCK